MWKWGGARGSAAAATRVARAATIAVPRLAGGQGGDVTLASSAGSVLLAGSGVEKPLATTVADAERVVARMYDNDPFSLWLGIERVEVLPGRCVLRMALRADMLNGFAIAHGGITYSLADSCLAFASNAHGIQSVSVETSISHTRPVKAGDVLTAVSEEKSLSRSIGVYYVTITDQRGEHKGQQACPLSASLMH